MSLYNPYNNIYMQDLQGMRDKIDRQMQQMQQLQNSQQAQQPQIQQTFQLSNPNQTNTEFDARYIGNIDEVKNTLVFKKTMFINRNMDKLWIKETNGEIRTFKLQEEIAEKEKNIEIDELKEEITEIKKMLSKQLQVQTKQESQAIGKIEPNLKIEKKK